MTKPPTLAHQVRITYVCSTCEKKRYYQRTFKLKLKLKLKLSAPADQPHVQAALEAIAAEHQPPTVCPTCRNK